MDNSSINTSTKFFFYDHYSVSISIHRLTKLSDACTCCTAFNFGPGYTQQSEEKLSCEMQGRQLFSCFVSIYLEQ